MTPLFLNPPSEANSQQMEQLPIMMFVWFTMIPTVMLMGTDHTTPYKRRLKEINRIIRIKKEIYKQKEKQPSGNQNYESKTKKVELEDESIVLEYKQSYIDNPMKVVQSVCGLLN